MEIECPVVYRSLYQAPGTWCITRVPRVLFVYVPILGTRAVLEFVNVVL